MIVDKYGRVAGSIDLAALVELYAESDDDNLKAHYREVAAENGFDLGDAPPVEEAEEAPAEPEEESTEEAGDGYSEDDLDGLRAEAESLGVKVDGRWGYDRLLSEVEAAKEG